MKKNIKPKAYIYPQPVLIIGTYDENGNPNAMNAAWGTVCDSNKVCLFIGSSHKTTKNFLINKAFTLSIADVDNVLEADFVGLVSGNDEINKLLKTKWKIKKGEYVNAPIIEDLPLVMECKVVSYNEAEECLIGEIINVSVDEEILTNGKIDLTKFKPIAYDTDNHAYYSLGEKVGNAFKDGLKIK